jgi:hypothetical protein
MAHSAKLLTTRRRTAVAIALTGLMFAVSLRGAFIQSCYRTSRLPLDHFLGLSYGQLVILNVAFYTYLCWLAFSFIRDTAGRERVFMVAWLSFVLVSPVKLLIPALWIPVHFISSIVLGVALVAAISLFRTCGAVNSINITAVE